MASRDQPAPARVALVRRVEPQAYVGCEVTEPAKDVILCLLVAIVVVAFGACMRDCDVRTDADYQRDRAREHAVELACLRTGGLYHDGMCVPVCWVQR